MSHTVVLDKPDTIRLKIKRPRGRKPYVRFIAYSSDNLRKIRKELKVSQKEMAAELGLSQGMISHFETESRPEEPSLQQIKAIDKFLSQKAGYKIIMYPEHDTENPGNQEFWGD